VRGPATAAARSALVAAALVASPAHGALQDEIQVYLDDLNRRGEVGLQLHLNATPAGIATPRYPGEVVSAGGARATAEFAYGLGGGCEAGAYLPTVYDGHGGYAVAGGKLRLKWVPVEAAGHAGWFAGANVELGRIAARYEAAATAAELRLIAGHTTDRWTLAVNPIFDWALSQGSSGRPDFNVALKAARNVGTGIQLGGEYYPDFGRLGQAGRFGDQDHRLYAALDVDRKPWQFNVGVGYGLSAAADRWTLKAIVTVPF
jgi:hypothetical protein